MNNKVSIIIPARNEIATSGGVNVLQKTVRGIYEKATGDFEVLVGFDGPEYQEFPPFPNLKVTKFPEVVGIKGVINALSSMAKGKYLLKTDAHCSFGKGFDDILQANMKDNWIVMPRFYVLNGENWEWQQRNGKPEFYDYFYLSCPFTDPRGFRFKAGGHWKERTEEVGHQSIDETPQIHGSCWFMTRDRYFELGGFPNKDPHGHAQEPIWLALNNQLEGGEVVVNKRTWYAHMHQQGNKRGYHMDRDQENKSYDLAAKTFMRDPRMMFWLEKWAPVMPTWPDDWRERYQQWLQR